MAARTRTAHVAPSSPMLGPPEPTKGPEVIPPSTRNTALSDVRFADFLARGRLSDDLVAKLLPFYRCTEVQVATLDTILDGRDV
jgi:hypothetical protein